MRLPLIALIAYVVGIEVLSRFGYSLPFFRSGRSEIALIYPLALLTLGSVAALFFDRRAGAAFTLIALLLIGFTVLNPTHR